MVLDGKQRGRRMARKKTALKGFLREVEAARAESGRNTLAAWFRSPPRRASGRARGSADRVGPLSGRVRQARPQGCGRQHPDQEHRQQDLAAGSGRHRDRAGPQAGQAASAARLAPDEIAPGVRRLEPDHAAPAAHAQEPVRPRMRLDIRPARPLTDEPPEDRSPSPASPQAEAAPAADAQAQIRRALDALDDRRTPMPRVVR